MRRIIEKIKKVSKIKVLAVVLILAGLTIMIPRVMGMREFYKEVQYAQRNHFQAGNLSPDLLRPWMSIRYIAAAYAVPQQYLFDAAHIQPKRETSMVALNRLNRQMNLGTTPDGRPVLMETIRKAITAYRASPVVTGLLEKNVEDWMNVQYIANSTGIPAETIFQELGIPMEGNAYLPLGPLSDTVKFAGGPKGLMRALQEIVDRQGKKP